MSTILAEERPASRRIRYGALLAILALAATLRFLGLAWGLRHPVHIDERVYVEHVSEMVRARDLDHRFYTYPGGFYFLLAPFVWAADATPLNPKAYLFCRWVVASIGVANVLLAYLVGSKLIGRWAGLAAALFIAVSPLDVTTAHQVRPDILLEGAGLLGLATWRRLAERRGDIRAGILIGLATAVKWTGLLLVPSYLFERINAGGRWFRGWLVAGALTVALVVALTPALLLRTESYVKGPGSQLHMYYHGKKVEGRDTSRNLAFYSRVIERTLGPLAMWLAVAGAFMALASNWKFWGPALLHPLITWIVMSTAALAFDRLMLPGLGVFFLLAAWPVQWLASRSRALASILMLSAAVLPLRSSMAYASRVSHPSAQDRALDWITSHVPVGSRVLETRPEADYTGRAGAGVGVNPGRYDTVFYPAGDPRTACLLALESDIVITGPGTRKARARDRFETAFEARDAAGDVEFILHTPRMRPIYLGLPLRLDQVTVSERPELAASLVDGDIATAWKPDDHMTGKEWIRVDFPTPVQIGRLEVFYANKPSSHPPELRVQLLQPGVAAFDTVPVVDLRSPLAEQSAGSGRPLSSLLLLDPRMAIAVQIQQKGARAELWAVSELRVDLRSDALADSCPQRRRRPSGRTGASGAHRLPGGAKAPLWRPATARNGSAQARAEGSSE